MGTKKYGRICLGIALAVMAVFIFGACSDSFDAVAWVQDNPKTYTVRLDYQHSGIVVSQRATAGDRITLPTGEVLSNAGVSGFIFSGWNTAADGSGRYYAPGSRISAQSVTLYAQLLDVTTIFPGQTNTPSDWYPVFANMHDYLVALPENTASTPYTLSWPSAWWGITWEREIVWGTYDTDYTNTGNAPVISKGLIESLPAGRYVALDFSREVGSANFAGRTSDYINEHGILDTANNWTGYPAADYITSIILPLNSSGGWYYIEDEAFVRFWGGNVSAIVLPSSGSVRVGYRAFDDTKLTSLTLPASIVSMGYRPLTNMPNLRELYLLFDPDTVYWEGVWDWWTDSEGFWKETNSLHDMLFCNETYPQDWGNHDFYGPVVTSGSKLTIYIPSALESKYRAHLGTDYNRLNIRTF